MNSYCTGIEETAAAVAKTVAKRIRITSPIKESTSPAMANPLGVLVTPTPERTSPKSQIIHPKTGTQPKNTAIKANTKPAVPIPLLLEEFWIMMVGLFSLAVCCS